MTITKQMLLQGMRNSDSSLPEFVFIEMGKASLLAELEESGLVVRVKRAGDWDQICITDKGREVARAEALESNE